MSSNGNDGTSNEVNTQSAPKGRDRPRHGGGNGSWRRNKRNAQNDSNGLEGVTDKIVTKPKLTHFPLGHHPAVQLAAGSFGSALLTHTPPITGLDPTIVVSPRRLHLTLGVMSLDEKIPHVQVISGQESQAPKSVSSALSLLTSLRPRILHALDGYPLRVPLTSIDIMKPERNDDARAHVLFSGPSENDLCSSDGQRLKRVCELVNSEFIKAGLIVDDKRPLKLHCTLINTSHRKSPANRGNRRRIPFSFAEIRDSDVVRALAPTGEFVALNHANRSSAPAAVPTEAGTGSNARRFEIPVDFGTHTVSEIQICRMGSWGPEGEYVCVGKIDL